MLIGSVNWDNAGDHFFYTGIDGVAFYVEDGNGWYGAANPWSGVTAVNESPSGAESNKQYADNIEYLNLISKEEFALTLEAFQVPEAFDACDGISSINGMLVRGQRRKSFGLVYRVKKGSDAVDAGGAVNADYGVANVGSGEGYVYHIVYGCRATPSSRDFGTVNDSPEAVTFSYEINTTALSYDSAKFGSNLTDIKEIVHIEIDASRLTQYQLGQLIAVLYGTESSGTFTPAAAMPTPKDLYDACVAVQPAG